METASLDTKAEKPPGPASCGRREAGGPSSAPALAAGPLAKPSTSHDGRRGPAAGPRCSSSEGTPARPPGWKPGLVAGAGLRNLGNSCYANAALQCLTYTPGLASWALRRRRGGRSCARRPPCGLCLVGAHVARALRRPGAVLEPRRALLAGFPAGQQGDAHEFLLATVAALREGCAEAARGAGPDVRGLFGGCLRSRLRCLRCHAASDTLEPFVDLALDVRAAASVPRALEALARPEVLAGADAPLCGRCGQRAPASKALSVHRPARVLPLLLRRFCATGGPAKLARAVAYPAELDLGACLSARAAAPPRYELYAVLVHVGASGLAGHYLSYVRAAGGQWFRMDDARVAACAAAEALGQQAYVLFYRQKPAGDRDGDGWSWPDDGDGEADDEAPGCPERDPDPWQAGPPPPDAEETAEETLLSLEQWRRLQEQSRPKEQLAPRKAEAGLPAHAVLIHGARKAPEPAAAAPGSCAAASKRKGRKGRRALLKWQPYPRRTRRTLAGLLDLETTWPSRSGVSGPGSYMRDPLVRPWDCRPQSVPRVMPPPRDSPGLDED